MPEEIDSTALKREGIESALRSEKERINQEIRAYPPPIPACDAQFNYLLERRDLVTVELARLHAICGDRQTAMEAVSDLREFLAASQCLNQSVKIEMAGVTRRVNRMIPLHTWIDLQERKREGAG